MDDSERDLDAAERALGTEASGTETAADRTARDDWQWRLAPLLDAVAPEPLPPGLYGRIAERIGERERVVPLAEVRRRLRPWRLTAAAMAAAALVLAALLVKPLVLPPPSERYVAIVAADDDGRTGLIVQFDTVSGVATIVPVDLAPPQGRSLEMWHLPDGATRPLSLGLLPATPQERPTLRAKPGDIFAISLEPEGGSPTGQPTQAIFHGKVVTIR